MNLRDMQYIAAVAEEHSFSKAAERCFVSQPALSTQVRKLEEYLGVTLFERGGREILVTEVGAAIIAHARRIIRESEQMLATARAAGASASQSVSIGAFPTLAPYLFPRLVAPLVQARPELRLELVEDKTAELLARIQDGRLDLALLALPVPVEGLEIHSLFSEEFLVCMPVGHPLAGRDAIHYEDLAGEDLLLLSEGHCMRDQALSVCAMQGLNFRRDYAATSLETLRQMVVAGAGITLMPRLAIRADSIDAGLVYRPLAPAAPARTIALVWVEEATRGGLYAERLLPALRALSGELFPAVA